MGAQELSEALWIHRSALETMLYRLETLLLVTSTGRTEWLGRAQHEVEAATVEMGTSGLSADVQLHELAGQWQAASGTTLTDVIASCPSEMWAQLFTDHRENIEALHVRIQSAAEANQLSARAGLMATDEAIAAAGLAGPHGAGSRGTARILDRAL